MFAIFPLSANAFSNKVIKELILNLIFFPIACSWAGLKAFLQYAMRRLITSKLRGIGLDVGAGTDVDADFYGVSVKIALFQNLNFNFQKLNIYL